MDSKKRQRQVLPVWCRLTRGERRKFRRAISFGTDASFRMRGRAVLYGLGGLSCREVVRRLRCSDWLIPEATVRFIERPPLGLVDERRFHREPRGLDQRVADVLLEALLKGALALGCSRNDWTLERLVWL